MSSPRPRHVVTRQRELAAKAHHLRHHPTLTEQLLWSALQGGRLGVAFRRQVVIARYIADFACREAHRNALLQRAGYRVLRIPAPLITSNRPAAVSLVREALAR